MFLKQHRKASLELEGRKLKGNFEVSLTNERDREVITEMVTEIRKQLREFDPAKAKRRKAKKQQGPPKLKVVPVKKKVVRGKRKK